MTVVLNLCPTPSFAGGLEEWLPLEEWGATLTRETSSEWHGPRTQKSAKLKAVVPTTGGGHGAGLRLKSTEVRSGETYSFGAVVHLGSLPSPGFVRFQVDWHEGTERLATATVDLAEAGTHQLVLVDQSAPSGATMAWLTVWYIVESGAASECTFFVDEIQANEGPTLNPYTDGSTPGAQWTQLAWRSETLEASQSPTLPTLGQLVLLGRQCEADAQRELTRVAEPVQGTVIAGTIQTGWYDQSVNSETGWFALCAEGSAFEEYVGSVLRVIYGESAIYVALLGAANLDTPLALARRAYAALAPLNVSSIPCAVEVR